MNTNTLALRRSFGVLLASIAAALLLSTPAAHALVYYGEGEADVTTGIDIVLDTEVAATGSASADLDTDARAMVRVVPASVRTDADLQEYVKGEIQADSDLRAVEVSDSVSVDYAQRAKLFGLIPVTVIVTAEVDADGRVSVRYPWYGFLLARVSRDADLQTNIQSRVDSVRAASSAGVDASAELDANAKARLINEVRSVLKSTLETQLQAENSAAATVK